MRRRALQLAGLALVALAAADLVAQRQGWLPPHAALLGLLFVVLLAVVATESVWLGVELVRRRAEPRRAVPGLIWRLGAVVALVAGTSHWLLSIQSFLVLSEGDVVPVGARSHLQEVHAGPLARWVDLAVALQLDRVELVPRGPSQYEPRSHVTIVREGAPVARAAVEVGEPAFAGPLRLQQGAFGFSPRIVIERAGRLTFDEHVPFTTSLAGAGGLSFGGDFTSAQDDLRVTGTVDIAELSEKMKGHVKLALQVTRGGAPLGQGQLGLGQFAELGDGYRIGFAGLKRWAELDLSRTHSRLPMAVGAALFALGLVASGAAALLARRAR